MFFDGFMDAAELNSRWAILVLMLLAFFPSTLIEPSRGQPVQITVARTSVTMTMALILQENLTSLPSINTYLDQSNSSIILQPISSAIHRLVPNANIANLQLHAKTSNSSAMWRLEENFTIVVTGANTNLGSSIRSRVDFVAMNVSQPLILSSQEINAVGSAYLLAFLNSQDPKTTGYYIDGHQTCPPPCISPVVAIETTATFWLLDLTWVPPISSWPESKDLLKQSTMWSLDLGFPRYNLTLGTRSPEGPLIRIRMATYYPTFSISVPANAWVDGDTISFYVPASFEVVMPFLATISLGALIVAFLWDWRLTRILGVKKKRR